MIRSYLIYFVVLIFSVPSILFSCGVCYGSIDDPMTRGMNVAILFLLGTIGMILTGVIGLIIYFSSRSKSLKNQGIN